MGKKLIIRGADFAQNAVGGLKTTGNLYALPFSCSLLNGQAGNLLLYYTNTRMTLTGFANRGVRIPEGCKITLSGLKGINGSRTALWIDYCMYSTNFIPQYFSANELTNNPAIDGNAQNLLKTGSEFVEANYFPLNHANGTSIEVTNPYNHDVYIVFVAKAGSSGAAMTLSQYQVGTLTGFSYTITTA